LWRALRSSVLRSVVLEKCGATQISTENLHPHEGDNGLWNNLKIIYQNIYFFNLNLSLHNEELSTKFINCQSFSSVKIRNSLLIVICSDLLGSLRTNRTIFGPLLNTDYRRGPIRLSQVENLRKLI
jgi:hypothetical protein